MSERPPRTMTLTGAARAYGLQVGDVRALIEAGQVWTVTPPGRTRPRVVVDGLEAWVRAGRRRQPAAKPAPIVTLPRRVAPNPRHRDVA